MKTYTYNKEIGNWISFEEQLRSNFPEVINFISEANDITINLDDLFVDENGLNSFIANYVDVTTDSQYGELYFKNQKERHLAFDTAMSEVVRSIIIHESISTEIAESKAVSIMYELAQDVDIWFYAGYTIPYGLTELPLIDKVNASSLTWLDFPFWNDNNTTLRNRIITLFKAY